MRSRYRCSMCPAIHNNSRSWLRSSSTHEPSDPPLRVVFPFPLSRESVVNSHRQRPGNGRTCSTTFKYHHSTEEKNAQKAREGPRLARGQSRGPWEKKTTDVFRREASQRRVGAAGKTAADCGSRLFKRSHAIALSLVHQSRAPRSLRETEPRIRRSFPK